MHLTLGCRAGIWRRASHQPAALRHQGSRTAAVVSRALWEMGQQLQTGIAPTGVVGCPRGARSRTSVECRRRLPDHAAS